MRSNCYKMHRQKISETEMDSVPLVQVLDKQSTAGCLTSDWLKVCVKQNSIQVRLRSHSVGGQ